MGINLPARKRFKAHYLYLVYVVFEDDVLPQLHRKTSGTNIGQRKHKPLCVCVCVRVGGVCLCTFITRNVLTKITELEKNNRMDLVQFNLSVHIRHLLCIHSCY